MNRRFFLAALGVAPAMQPLISRAASPMKVYKDPSCGCCGAWIDHIKSAGFSVTMVETGDLQSVRKRLGMPERFAGCHTAVADGYVIEGHVPAAEIKRLLATRPKALGLSVPGMPVGAPGMEYGGRIDRYEVLLIDPFGKQSTFATYPEPTVESQ